MHQIFSSEVTLYLRPFIFYGIPMHLTRLHRDISRTAGTVVGEMELAMVLVAMTVVIAVVTVMGGWW